MSRIGPNAKHAMRRPPDAEPKTSKPTESGTSHDSVFVLGPLGHYGHSVRGSTRRPGDVYFRGDPGERAHQLDMAVSEIAASFDAAQDQYEMNDLLLEAVGFSTVQETGGKPQAESFRRRYPRYDEEVLRLALWRPELAHTFGNFVFASSTRLVEFGAANLHVLKPALGLLDVGRDYFEDWVFASPLVRACIDHVFRHLDEVLDRCGEHEKSAIPVLLHLGQLMGKLSEGCPQSRAHMLALNRYRTKFERLYPYDVKSLVAAQPPGSMNKGAFHEIGQALLDHAESEETRREDERRQRRRLTSAPAEAQGPILARIRRKKRALAEVRRELGDRLVEVLVSMMGAKSVSRDWEEVRDALPSPRNAVGAFEDFLTLGRVLAHQSHLSSFNDINVEIEPGKGLRRELIGTIEFRTFSRLTGDRFLLEHDRAELVSWFGFAFALLAMETEHALVGLPQFVDIANGLLTFESWGYRLDRGKPKFLPNFRRARQALLQRTRAHLADPGVAQSDASPDIAQLIEARRGTLRTAFGSEEDHARWRERSPIRRRGDQLGSALWYAVTSSTAALYGAGLTLHLKGGGKPVHGIMYLGGLASFAAALHCYRKFVSPRTVQRKFAHHLDRPGANLFQGGPDDVVMGQTRTSIERALVRRKTGVGLTVALILLITLSPQIAPERFGLKQDNLEISDGGVVKRIGAWFKGALARRTSSLAEAVTSRPIPVSDEIRNHKAQPRPDIPRFFTLHPPGYSISLWINGLSTLSDQGRVHPVDTVGEIAVAQGTRFDETELFQDAIRSQVANGRLVAVYPFDEYPTPLGSRPVAVLGLRGTPTDAWWTSADGLRINRNDAALVAVAYEPDGSTTSFGSVAPSQPSNRAASAQFLNQHPHVAALIALAKKQSESLQAVNALRDFIGQRVDYGFADWVSPHASDDGLAADLLEVADATGELSSIDFVHSRWICNQFAAAIHYLAREAGHDSHLVRCFRDAGPGPNGTGSESHLGLAVQTARGLRYVESVPAQRIPAMQEATRATGNAHDATEDRPVSLKDFIETHDENRATWPLVVSIIAGLLAVGGAAWWLRRSTKIGAAKTTAAGAIPTISAPPQDGITEQGGETHTGSKAADVVVAPPPAPSDVDAELRRLALPDRVAVAIGFTTTSIYELWLDPPPNTLGAAMTFGARMEAAASVYLNELSASVHADTGAFQEAVHALAQGSVAHIEGLSSATPQQLAAALLEVHARAANRGKPNDLSQEHFEAAQAALQNIASILKNGES